VALPAHPEDMQFQVLSPMQSAKKDPVFFFRKASRNQAELQARKLPDHISILAIAMASQHHS
jgi:hypothetical protein